MPCHLSSFPLMILWYFGLGMHTDAILSRKWYQEEEKEEEGFIMIGNWRKVLAGKTAGLTVLKVHTFPAQVNMAVYAVYIYSNTTLEIFSEVPAFCRLASDWLAGWYCQKLCLQEDHGIYDEYRLPNLFGQLLTFGTLGYVKPTSLWYTTVEDFLADMRIVDDIVKNLDEVTAVYFEITVGRFLHDEVVANACERPCGTGGDFLERSGGLVGAHNGNGVAVISDDVRKETCIRVVAIM
ncbi:hypothetical protein K474DRAFT_1702507, partial [Panus rudis PR-1116 ss-1]